MFHSVLQQVIEVDPVIELYFCSLAGIKKPVGQYGPSGGAAPAQNGKAAAADDDDDFDLFGSDDDDEEEVGVGRAELFSSSRQNFRPNRCNVWKI